MGSVAAVCAYPQGQFRFFGTPCCAPLAATCAILSRPCPSLFSLCCIAPVLAAKVLHGVEVTVGHEQEEGGKWPYAGTVEAIKALGAKHCVRGVTISFPAARVAVACGAGDLSSGPWGLPWAGSLLN